MRKKILLVGAGGHAKSCLNTIEKNSKFKILGFIDKNIKANKFIMNYPVLGNDNFLIKNKRKFENLLISFGSIYNLNGRKLIYNKFKKLGFKFPVVKSNKANISNFSKIGEGTIIMDGVFVGPNVKIGKNCIINTNSLIEHDVNIGDHCHISTSVTINGNVNIDDLVFIGSGSIIKNSVNIKNKRFIKMGSKII